MLPPPPPQDCPAPASPRMPSSCLFYTLKLQVHHDHQVHCQGHAIWSLARFQGGTVNYNLHDRLAKFPRAPHPPPHRVNPQGSVSWPLLLMTRGHTRAGFPGLPWTGLHSPPSPVPDVSTSVWLHGASHKAFLVNMPEIPRGFQTCPATISAPRSFPSSLSDHTISQFSFCVLSARSAHLLIPEALIKRHT